MTRIAYCGSCRRYVQLTAEGACPQGHPRSELRDVREGTLESAPVVGKSSASPGIQPVARPEFRDEGGLLAQVIGKGIILVPVGLILVWGVWTGYEQFSGMGMPVWMKLGASVLSLLATVGTAFLFAGRSRR